MTLRVVRQGLIYIVCLALCVVRARSQVPYVARAVHYESSFNRYCGWPESGRCGLSYVTFPPGV